MISGLNLYKKYMVCDALDDCKIWKHRQAVVLVSGLSRE